MTSPTRTHGKLSYTLPLGMRVTLGRRPSEPSDGCPAGRVWWGGVRVGCVGGDCEYVCGGVPGCALWEGGALFRQMGQPQEQVADQRAPGRPHSITHLAPNCPSALNCQSHQGTRSC